MNVKSLILFMTYFALAGQIQAKSPKYQVTNWWRLEGESSRETTLNTKGDNSSFLTVLTVKRNIKNWGQLIVSPGFRFATGNGQGLIHDNRPRNSIFANEAVLKLKRGHHFIKLGSLNQRHVGIRPIVDPYTSFPGVLSKLSFYHSKHLELYSQAQMTIPSSYTFSGQSTGLETTPQFSTASFELKMKSNIPGHLHLGAVLFEYKDLPQSLAVESSTRGNFVNLTSSTTGFFNYDFKGYGAFIAHKSPLFDKVFLVNDVQWAINSEAPTSQATALYTWNGVYIDYNQDSALDIRALYFRQKPEIAPGRLNYGLDYNNRVGYGTRIRYMMKKENIAFTFGYENTDPIYTSTVMSNRKTIFLRMEGFDELI